MLTVTGKKMLQRYVDAEKNGRLKRFIDGAGNVFFGVSPYPGDGGETAAMNKLEREGFINVKHGISNRHCCMIITPEGRQALLAATN